MNIHIESIAFLLLIAATLSMFLRRFKVPQTVGLILTVIVIIVSPLQFDDLRITEDLIFYFFLPTLIYEAAIHIKLREILRDLPGILTISIVAVILSATVTTAGMYFFARWELESAILFGILIASIDPVSMIARLKEAGVHGRLRLLMKAESLFNNSVVAVALVFALALADSSVSIQGTVLTLVISIVGGIFCGFLVTGAMLALAGQREDRLVQILFTMVAAYGSFLLAEYFHFSGVLASLVAGLMTRNLGSFTDKGREEVRSLWEFYVFFINLLVFVMIGIRGDYQDFVNLLILIAIAIILVLLGRGIAIYLLSPLFLRSDLQDSSNYQHIFFWGGMRGTLALTLALVLPPEIHQREAIIAVAFGVVAFSIFAQGLTMVLLLRKLKEIS